MAFVKPIRLTGGGGAPEVAATRPPGRARGRRPSACPASASSSLSAQRSGRSSPSCAGFAPFSAMQPVLSPIARISATSSSRRAAARRAAPPVRPAWPRSGRPPACASWIRVGTTHSTAGWARFHWQASWIGVSRARSAIGRTRSSFSSPASIQPSGRKARWSPCGELHAGPQVAPEEAAVVDDPGDHPDAVLGRRVEAELARPGLERVEDDHRPVDAVAEALEAGDQVEGEAVGRARGDADPRRQAGLAQGRHPVPDRLARVADPVGVVEEQQVEGGGAEPLEAALGRHPQVAGVLVRAAQARIGEARKAARPVALALVEVVADGADQAVVLARAPRPAPGRAASRPRPARRCRR